MPFHGRPKRSEIALYQQDIYQRAAYRTPSPVGQAKAKNRQAFRWPRLQLWVTPDGAKHWRLAYRFGGDQKLLAIGVYPSVDLKEARAARENARRLLANGVDPSEAKKQAKIEKANASENIFAAIAAESIDKKRREQKAVLSRSARRNGF